MGIRASIAPGSLAKHLGFDMAKLKKEPKGTRWEIGYIFGRATGLKGKIDTLNPENTKNVLVGMFEAADANGEIVMQSGQCYLPNAVHSLIEGQLLDNAVSGVDFTIKLDAIEDESAVTGYRYDAQMVNPPSKADPLAEMRALLAKPEEAPALPAPKKTAKDKAAE